MFRVLDYNYIGGRLFTFFFNVSYDRKEKYDIVIVDRDILQNEFDDVKSCLIPNGKIIVDITTESGCLNGFFSESLNPIVEQNKDIQFYLFSEFDSIYRKNFDNLNCLIYHGLSNYCFFGLPDSDTYWNCYTIKSEKMNKIMSLNGSIRSHRILFLLYLIENKLVDKLLCSFKFYTHNDSNTFNEEMYISFLEEFRRLNYINSNEINTLIDYKQHLPITIDKFDLNDRKINVDTFSSVVNVVTENTYDYTSCIDVRETNTFTEKTLIPFIIEQIPIFVSLPNHVQFLRDIGYDVFDDLIDHSYDREPDGIKRMKMIVSEIQRIIDIDFVSFYHNNRTRFLKNRELTIYNTYNGYTKVREFLIENKLF